MSNDDAPSISTVGFCCPSCGQHIKTQVAVTGSMLDVTNRMIQPTLHTSPVHHVCGERP